jgi:thioredoxin 1
MAKDVTEADFEQEVLKSKGLVLVDFWAVWCGPCRLIAPIVEEVSKGGSVKVVKVNVDENKNLAAKFKIFSIPTLILFKNGKPVESKVGVMSKSQLESWIESAKQK